VQVSAAPYSHRSDGLYEPTGRTFAGAPVREHTDQYGLVWSLYRRAPGYWVLDFNAVDNGWSGTAAYSRRGGADGVASVTRWSTSGMSVEEQAASPPSPSAPDASPGAGAPTAVYASGDIPYATRTVGVYAPSGRTYAAAPVYEHADAWGYTWSLYRRTDGTWVIDFNEVDERWSGTVAYSHADVTKGAKQAVWTRAITVTDVPAGAASTASVAPKGAVPDDPRDDMPPPAKPDNHMIGELQDLAENDAPPAGTEADGEGEGGANGEGEAESEAEGEAPAVAAEEVTEEVDEHQHTADSAEDVVGGSGMAVVLAGGAAGVVLITLLVLLVCVRMRQRRRGDKSQVQVTRTDRRTSRASADADIEARAMKGVKLERGATVVNLTHDMSEDSVVTSDSSVDKV